MISATFTMLFLALLLTVVGCSAPNEQPETSSAPSEAPSPTTNTEPVSAEQETRPALSRDDMLIDHARNIMELPLDYKEAGNVLRALAFLECQNIHPPPRFKVLSNLIYEAGGATAGVLDLVIWDNDTQTACFVYQVELSGNPTRANERADQRLENFRRHIDENSPIQFLQNGTVTDLNNSHFKSNQSGKIGNRSTKEFGFDLEIDITRPEVGKIQEKVLGFQHYKAFSQQRVK